MAKKVKRKVRSIPTEEEGIKNRILTCKKFIQKHKKARSVVRKRIEELELKLEGHEDFIDLVENDVKIYERRLREMKKKR